MGVNSAELKKDGRKVKQSFTGIWTTYIITSGGTTTQFTSPNVKVSGQVVYCVYCAAQYVEGLEYDLYYRFETTGSIDGPYIDHSGVSPILDAETGKHPTYLIGTNPGEVGNPPYRFTPYMTNMASKIPHPGIRFGLSPHGNGTVWNAAPNAHAQEI